MKLATSPEFLESVANDPRVRPYIGGDGVSQFHAGERWANTVALEWPEGGVIFEQILPLVYEAHWLFLPKTLDVVGKGKQALRYLFTHTNAEKVLGKTPIHFRHARKAAQAVGMRHLFDCRDVSYSELTRRDWLTDKEV